AMRECICQGRWILLPREPQRRQLVGAQELVNSFADWGLLYLTRGRNQRSGPCTITAPKGKEQQMSGRHGPIRTEKKVPRLGRRWLRASGPHSILIFAWWTRATSSFVTVRRTSTASALLM